MKLNLRLNLELDTGDRKNAILKTNRLAATGIQSLPKSHRRKGSRKSKPPSLLKKLLQATRWIPPDVFAAFFTALFGTMLKVFPK